MENKVSIFLTDKELEKVKEVAKLEHRCLSRQIQCLVIMALNHIKAEPNSSKNFKRLGGLLCSK